MRALARWREIVVVGLLELGAISATIACSEDESNPESAAGAGAGGRGGSSGSGGRAGAAGASGAAMYTVAQTCEMFAAVTCAKAAECGLVLEVTDAGLICIDCNAETLDIIARGCAADLAGPKDAAALDRCLTSSAASSCTDACSDDEVAGCEVIEELSGDEGGEPVVCDMACVSD